MKKRKLINNKIWFLYLHYSKKIVIELTNIQFLSVIVNKPQQQIILE